MGQDRNTATGREALRRELLAYGAAGRTLNGWISGARALALLRGALSSGIFDAARTPSTVAEISAATGVEGPRVADVCLALEAHGVFERDGESYRLSKDFAALASPDPSRERPPPKPSSPSPPRSPAWPRRPAASQAARRLGASGCPPLLAPLRVPASRFLLPLPRWVTVRPG